MTPCRTGLIAAALLVLPPGAWPATDAPACAAAAAAIPPRAASGAGGADFAARVAGLDERARDAAIRDELLAGNLPAFLRQAVPVELSVGAGVRAALRVTLCVLPDYLAIGSDADHLRWPMSLPTALAVARAFGFTLPTRRIVDAIYAQAGVRLVPQPLPAGDAMRSTATYVQHHGLIEAQRAARQAPRTALAAGHKKDLVLSGRLWQLPGRLALYGWHRGPLAPIQPLSTVHGAWYADYSHGVRLVGTTAFVEGRPRSIFDLLRDARLAPLLSDEGPLDLAPDPPPGPAAP